ncbi:hypothetical protein IJJ08_00985 [bacterium]|nr:hypothetical protein [bacterium]
MKSNSQTFLLILILIFAIVGVGGAVYGWHQHNLQQAYWQGYGQTDFADADVNSVDAAQLPDMSMAQTDPLSHGVKITSNIDESSHIAKAVTPIPTPSPISQPLPLGVKVPTVTISSVSKLGEAEKVINQIANNNWQQDTLSDGNIRYRRPDLVEHGVFFYKPVQPVNGIKRLYLPKNSSKTSYETPIEITTELERIEPILAMAGFVPDPKRSYHDRFYCFGLDRLFYTNEQEEIVIEYTVNANSSQAFDCDQDIQQSFAIYNFGAINQLEIQESEQILNVKVNDLFRSQYFEPQSTNDGGIFYLSSTVDVTTKIVAPDHWKRYFGWWGGRNSDAFNVYVVYDEQNKEIIYASYFYLGSYVHEKGDDHEDWFDYFTQSLCEPDDFYAQQVITEFGNPDEVQLIRHQYCPEIR